MKKIKKVLPILASAAVGTIPFAATSCSNVWVDLLATQYQPNFQTLTAKELTSKEAITKYKEHFLAKPGDIIPDFYWGSSMYCRHSIHKLADEPTKVLTFLNNIYDVKAKDTTNGIILSYKLKAQVELRHDTPSGSYSINSYDLYWEINNLEFWPVHYLDIEAEGRTNKLWSFSPIKFDSIRGLWWSELKGDEQVKFEFKANYRGFGKNGGQNYVWESSESAIIDEAHKYTPELSEVYTSVMLFDSYYLSDITPRMNCNNRRLEGKKDGTGAKTSIQFNFGEETVGTYKNTDITFTAMEPYVYSPYSSGFKLDQDGVGFGETKKVPTSSATVLEVPITFTPKEGVPAPQIGDIVYYTVKADVSNDSSSWTEYFFVSTLIDEE